MTNIVINMDYDDNDMLKNGYLGVYVCAWYMWAMWFLMWFLICTLNFYPVSPFLRRMTNIVINMDYDDNDMLKNGYLGVYVCAWYMWAMWFLMWV